MWKSIVISCLFPDGFRLQPTWPTVRRVVSDQIFVNVIWIIEVVVLSGFDWVFLAFLLLLWPFYGFGFCLPFGLLSISGSKVLINLTTWLTRWRSFCLSWREAKNHRRKHGKSLATTTNRKVDKSQSHRMVIITIRMPKRLSQNQIEQQLLWFKSRWRRFGQRRLVAQWVKLAVIGNHLETNN